jgi:2-polyprenyl-3-methyl-5-hydroxy-6-metoxy-1,4-benzoquinol methylase
MASAKEHYDNFLAEHYTWMSGGYDTKVQENKNFFLRNGLESYVSGKALDLGCGAGFQSIALAQVGFRVLGVDLCESLLRELQIHIADLDIEFLQGDILDDGLYSNKGPFDVAVCMGDTLTHLREVHDVVSLFEKVYSVLEDGGKLALSFRDFTTELEGIDRMIPVRSDDRRLMATFLEYTKNHVNVHDIIYIRRHSGWEFRKSVYRKLRIGKGQVQEILRRIGYNILLSQVENGFSVVVAQK